MSISILKQVSLNDYVGEPSSHFADTLKKFQGYYVRTTFGNVAGHTGDIFEGLSIKSTDDGVSIVKKSVVFWPWYPPIGSHDIPTHDFYELTTFYIPSAGSESGYISGKLVDGELPKEVSCLLRPENITETDSGIKVIGSAMPFENPENLDYFSPFKTIFRERKEGIMANVFTTEDYENWNRTLNGYMKQAKVFEKKGEPVTVGIEFLVS